MGFANIIVVGLDPVMVNVGNIAIGMLNASYFPKATLWLNSFRF
jgi:hypothetical protein